MPTGGGKSLCYQLPALALGQTVVVISPLIALMQDQVAQLGDMGIPAAVLNSTQPAEEQRAVMRAAAQGAFRLLYLSPERLARPDTIDWLRRLPLAFFAIDEAHCISEWGHEFRPEYRQLSSLRENFPDKPIAAFTASATRRVRHDILEQLRLRDPHKYIASFHRANLRYVAHQCDKETHPRLLLAALRAYQGESAIVYAPTIAAVEQTVDFLADRRIAAVPYHGQMETATRRRNQERWMNDEVRVLVGTIAFGLGINKPAVRAVIHTSLPKSIEQFYQEAGRAGRDGLARRLRAALAAERRRPAGLLHRKAEDRGEKERAWQRYHAVRRFVESARCRHLQICTHFGQMPKWQRCEMCDVCGNIPEWLKAPSEEAAGREEEEAQAEGSGAARTAAGRAARAAARGTGPAAGPGGPAARRRRRPTATWSNSSRSGAGARPSAPPFRPTSCSATPRSRISAASSLRISASCWASPGSASARRNCTEAKSSPPSRLTATGPAPPGPKGTPRCRRFRPPKRPCACWRRARASKRSRRFAAASFRR